MHSNLTAADVAKYPDAKILLFDNVMNQVAINFKEQELMLIRDGGSHGYWSNVSDCHLLLKPLSEISDDDAVEVAKIANIGKYEAKEFIGCGKDNLKTIGYYIVGEFINSTYSELRMHTDMYIDIIDYLRKKGYDMDNYLNTNKAKQ